MSQTRAIGSTQHAYDSYSVGDLKHSIFDFIKRRTMPMNGGYLYPIYSTEDCLPGETVIIQPSVFARMFTQLNPFFDNVIMDIHFWKVPHRLVWKHLKNFFGEQKNPTDSTDYLTPQVTTPSGGCAVGSLFDYFALTPLVAGYSVNAFRPRAYNLIWNEWYRDENIQNSVVQNDGDNGTDNYTDFALLKRGKRKDYFTSVLPWAQKGPAVNLPLGTTAPVIGTGSVIGNGQPISLKAIGGSTFILNGDSNANYLANGGTSNRGKQMSLNDDPASSSMVVDSSGMSVDLTGATASTINALRDAFSLQKFFETDARCGTRYIEKILGHFHTKSPDARQQRPEFIGGMSCDLNMQIVPQTSATVSGSTPQGNLASYATFNNVGKRIITSFTEHSMIIALASIRTNYTYCQGVHRSWSRHKQTDYYFPEFSNLGEQAVLNKEIYVQGSSVTDSDGNIVDDGVFGYQERWAEYRDEMDEICGIMRPNVPNNIGYYSLAQVYSQLPVLNSDFIEENPPFDRVTGISHSESTPTFFCNFAFKIRRILPMPKWSIPGITSVM